MGLQQRLDAISKSFASQLPPGKLDPIHAAVSDLRASRILERIVGVGDRAPRFSLVSTSGELVRLDELLRRGPIILGFYRGRW